MFWFHRKMAKLRTKVWFCWLCSDYYWVFDCFFLNYAQFSFFPVFFLSQLFIKDLCFKFFCVMFSLNSSISRPKTRKWQTSGHLWRNLISNSLQVIFKLNLFAFFRMIRLAIQFQEMCWFCGSFQSYRFLDLIAS